MKNKEEREAFAKEQGFDQCAGDNICKALGITQEFKDEIAETAVGMMAEYRDGIADGSEFLTSMISLGDTENQRLWLTWKATTFMGEVDNSKSFMNMFR